MSAPEKSGILKCPACGTDNEYPRLAEDGYHCYYCRLELAYLDMSINGVTRGVLGYLRQAGEVIDGRYRVASVLGRGGFGATYLVEDLRLNGKRRALKEVPEPHFSECEATLLSRLHHPAIPDIIDRYTADGMVYMALEFGGTRTLETVGRKHPNGIPLAKLLPWIGQVCDVLSYLHGQNPPIIHRDLKPSNILLDDGDHIMLIDFGIAKESLETALTHTLGRAATQGFSPPEQVIGTGTDERSDIYALGATFYALLTGVKPIPAHERVAGKELKPPRQLAANIPLQIDRAILSALELNANLRPQTVADFRQMLEAGDTAAQAVNTEIIANPNAAQPEDLPLTVPSQPTPDPPPPGRARHRLSPKLWALILGTTAVLAIIALGYLLGTPQRTPAHLPPSAKATQPPDQPEPSKPSAAATSPAPPATAPPPTPAAPAVPPPVKAAVKGQPGEEASTSPASQPRRSPDAPKKAHKPAAQQGAGSAWTIIPKGSRPAN